MKRVLFVFSALVLSLLVSRVLYADQYIVAVRAKNGINAAELQWQATLDYLQKKVPGNHQFKLMPILSLNEIIKKSVLGDFDFVITNPSSFLEIERLHGVTALATLSNNRAGTAQNRFGSVIFTHVRNVDILQINDLKNKKVIAVSAQSFGGWQAACLEIMENNINPYRDFKKLMFAGGIQDDVVYAVRDGKADVGIVRTDQLERMQVSGDIDMRYIRVINNKNVKSFPFFLSTKLYPEWVFAAMNNISDQQSNNISKVLLNVSSDSRAAQLGKYMGWVAPMNNYSVKKLMQRLKIDYYGK